MNYQKHIAEDRRYIILKLLSDDNDYSLNSHILKTALRDFGHNISADLLLTDINWLKEQGLLTVIEVGSLHVATLTRRGMDVAEGSVQVPGVRRPYPEE